MHSRFVRTLLGALLAGTISNTNAIAAGNCDRACLRNLLDQYLNAIVKHDPSGAPLMIGFRQTENALAVLPGEGVWKSITALGKLQRRYLDSVNGSAGYYGTIVEGSETGIATLRLQTDDRKITEAEWVIARTNTGTPAGPGPGSTSAEAAESTPPLDKPLPKEQRVPRSVMIAVTNSYFDSVQSGNTALMIAHPGWVRLENGIGTGQGPGGARRGGAPGGGGARGTAGERGRGGRGAVADDGQAAMCGGICGVVARRYPIVDEEAGVVLGMVVFMRPPGSTNRRNLLTEWFAIDSGKIRGIYAAMHYLDPTIPAPNWPPYDGNWPLAPSLPGVNGR